MNKQPKSIIKTAEHLFEIYPSMPRYANDPSQSDIVKTYDFILRRFQGFYNHQPTYFIKAGTTPLLFGDQHPYNNNYRHISFNSSQDIIIAIARTKTPSIRINNYQSALYGEKTLSSQVGEWKLNQSESSQKFMNAFTQILGLVAEELSLKDLGGVDLLIYTGVIEDEFIGWKQALYGCFYTALMTVITQNKPIQSESIRRVLQRLAQLDEEIVDVPQLVNYRHGHLMQHSGVSAKEVKDAKDVKDAKEMELPENLSIVIAHSLTPLPKKLIQGKRFNLRRCELLIALEYLKTSAGSTHNFQSLHELQTFIGCTTEQLLKQIEESLPSGKLTPEQIESDSDRSLIDILKAIPYANSVIDQNKHYYPKDRALFFLKEEMLIERLSKEEKLTSQNLVDSLKESYSNQVELLEVGSEQIEGLVEAAGEWAKAWKIVGNGWGGNVVFLCEKGEEGKLVEQVIERFYLAEENRILLSDDLEQYIHVLERPNTGMAILDPQSEIWY